MAPATLLDSSSTSDSNPMTPQAASEASSSPPYRAGRSLSVGPLDVPGTHGNHGNDSTDGVGLGMGQKAMQIAIVGMACRLPGSVASPGEFWELLSRQRAGFSPVPKGRFNHDVFYHPNPGKTGCYHSTGGSFLDVDLAAFDAPFFGLTEKEAISMDPQQRLLLECTFEALENGGIPKHSIIGEDIGVFMGGSFAEYESHLFRDSDTIPMHQATGNAINSPHDGKF
jgi:hypothetical protein